MDGGLKLHVARVGSPVQLRTTGFGVKETTLNPYPADWPAVTWLFAKVVVTETGGRICVGSLAVLSEVKVSPPPETITVLVTEDGAFAATFTVNVTSEEALGGI